MRNDSDTKNSYVIVMTETTEETPEIAEETPAPPVKEKKPRSEAQMAVLEKARQKAFEMRAKKADESKIKKEEIKVRAKLSDAEKDKEILALKQTAVEKELNVEIVKPKPKPKRVKSEPDPQYLSTVETPLMKPEIRKCLRMDPQGNLIFHENK